MRKKEKNNGWRAIVEEAKKGKHLRTEERKRMKRVIHEIGSCKCKMRHDGVSGGLTGGRKWKEGHLLL